MAAGLPVAALPEALAALPVRGPLAAPAAPEASVVLEALEAALGVPEASLGATGAAAVLVAPVAPEVPGEPAEAPVGLRPGAVPEPGDRCCRRGRMRSVRPESFGRRVPSPSGVRALRPVGPGVRRRLRPPGGRGVPGLGMSGGLWVVAGFGLVAGPVLTVVALRVLWVAVPTSGD